MRRKAYKALPPHSNEAYPMTDGGEVSKQFIIAAIAIGALAVLGLFLLFSDQLVGKAFFVPGTTQAGQAGLVGSPDITLNTEQRYNVFANIGSSTSSIFEFQLTFDNTIVSCDVTQTPAAGSAFSGDVDFFAGDGEFNCDQANGRLTYRRAAFRAADSPGGQVQVAQVIFRGLSVGDANVRFGFFRMYDVSGDAVTLTALAPEEIRVVADVVCGPDSAVTLAACRDRASCENTGLGVFNDQGTAEAGDDTCVACSATLTCATTPTLRACNTNTGRCSCTADPGTFTNCIDETACTTVGGAWDGTQCIARCTGDIGSAGANACPAATPTCNANGICEAGMLTCDAGLDIMIVIDNSGSMCDPQFNNPDRLPAAKQAAIAFLNRLDNTQHRVGLVSFDRRVNLRQGLTEDYEALRTRIDAIPCGGGTNIGAGIERAQRELSTNGREGISRVMVILSDGEPIVDRNGGNCPPGPTAPNTCTAYTLDEAREAATAGTVVYSIGLGVATGSFLETVVRDIANEPANYLNAPTETNLQAIYQRISEGICQNTQTCRTQIASCTENQCNAVDGAVWNAATPPVCRACTTDAECGTGRECNEANGRCVLAGCTPTNRIACVQGDCATAGQGVWDDQGDTDATNDVCRAARCNGNVPANGNLCTDDDQNLRVDATRSLVDTCGAASCEFTCANGFVRNGAVCTAVPPVLEGFRTRIRAPQIALTDATVFVSLFGDRGGQTNVLLASTRERVTIPANGEYVVTTTLQNAGQVRLLRAVVQDLPVNQNAAQVFGQMEVTYAAPVAPLTAVTAGPDRQTVTARNVAISSVR
jgi:Mg-chelatase subunit ChlD